jgi:L-type amino acid transporter 8
MSLVYLSSTDIYALINYASFVETAFITLSISGMLYMRYTHPDLKRPIKVRTNFILILPN